MKLLWVFTMTGFLALSACDLEGKCSGTSSATFSIGTDVTADFDVNDVQSSGEILTSDCSSVPAGTTASSTLDNVKRVGNTLTITTSDETISVDLDGNSVPAFSKTESFAGCTFTAILEGTLNSSDNTLTASGAFSAEGVTCTAPF